MESRILTSVLGSIGVLNPQISTLMIIVIVFAVLTVEFIFYGLRKLCKDTPFNNLVSVIENELMIVGFTAFIFKIVFTTQPFLSDDVYLSLEFADILVPLFSFCNCFIGVFLILMSVRQCNIWSKSIHIKLDQLIDEFFDKVNQTSLGYG